VSAATSVRSCVMCWSVRAMLAHLSSHDVRSGVASCAVLLLGSLRHSAFRGSKQHAKSLAGGVVNPKLRVAHQGGGLFWGQGQAFETVPVLGGCGPVALGGGAADARSRFHLLGRCVEGVADGERLLHREQVAQPRGDAGAVAVRGRGMQVPVLDSQRHAPSRPAVDEPGEGPPKAAQADGAVGVGWYRVVGPAQVAAALVAPGGEGLDAVADPVGGRAAWVEIPFDEGGLEEAGTEEQVLVVQLLDNGDGVGHRLDRFPRHGPLNPCAYGSPVRDSGLEGAAADLVARHGT
jgi:hypothetical protein